MKPPCNVLFVYAIESLTGLSAKADKIAEGFSRYADRVDCLYFYNARSKIQKLFNYVQMHIKAVGMLLRPCYTTVYMRYAYYFVFLYLLCRILNVPFQIEINSKSQNELAQKKQRLRKIFDRIALSVGIVFAGRIHVVSRELLTYFSERYPGKTIVFNPNFVVDGYYSPALHHAPKPKINLLFLGNTEQAWHGIDLFIEMVCEHGFFLFDKINIHIVGNIAPAIEQLTINPNVSAHIFLHGFLSGEKKYAVLSKMDIGIGGFSLSAKGIKETTSIKNGEYLYSGLPLIIGYEDSAISSDHPFVLKIDIFDPQNAVDQIVGYLDFYGQHPEIRIQAHEYAKKNLTVDTYIERIMAPL